MEVLGGPREVLGCTREFEGDQSDHKFSSSSERLMELCDSICYH